MVVDNADDLELLFNTADKNNKDFSSGLVDCLPESPKGSILFTTRNNKVAVKHAENSIIEAKEMSEVESQELFKKALFDKSLTKDKENILRLLDLFCNLPLAIKQAAAFLNENKSTSVSDYLEIYNSNDESFIELLSEDFQDYSRYSDVKNPVASTWWISFKQLERLIYLLRNTCVSCHVLHNKIFPFYFYRQLKS
jgi:hypothetical protein